MGAAAGLGGCDRDYWRQRLRRDSAAICWTSAEEQRPTSIKQPKETFDHFGPINTNLKVAVQQIQQAG